MPRGVQGVREYPRFHVHNNSNVWVVSDRERKVPPQFCPTRRDARKLAEKLNKGPIDNGHQADAGEPERDHGISGRH